MKDKKIVKELRALHTTEGGVMITVSGTTMEQAQWGGEPMDSTRYNVKVWPEDYPDVEGLNEMWAGGDDDKDLVLSMINNALEINVELVMCIGCKNNLMCPEGQTCIDGQCL